MGGLLGGKCGLLCCKMGTGADGFAPLREALAASDVPISQILPSHAERAVLLSDCRAWLQAGGNVDFTAGVEAGAAPSTPLPTQHSQPNTIHWSSGHIRSTGRLQSMPSGLVFACAF